MAQQSSMLVAGLNPLGPDDLQTLQNIVQNCQQLLQLISQAQAIGLPVDDIAAKTKYSLEIAQKLIATFFPDDSSPFMPPQQTIYQSQQQTQTQPVYQQPPPVGPTTYVVDSPEYEAAKAAGILNQPGNYRVTNQ